MKFFFGYIKHVFFCSFKISFYYFKFIGLLFIWFKALFFSNLLPSFIQILLSFHFLFNHIWDLYLLLIFYSSILIFLPHFIYKYNIQKNYAVEFELKVIIIFCFILLFNFEIAFLSISNLICVDMLIINRNRLMNKNDYNFQHSSLTQKALDDLRVFILNNYDQTITKFKKKQRYLNIN